MIQAVQIVRRTRGMRMGASLTIRSSGEVRKMKGKVNARCEKSLGNLLAKVSEKVKWNSLMSDD